MVELQRDPSHGIHTSPPTPQEDNKDPWDVSSTEPFQRDNFLHFLSYWIRQLSVGFWVELPLYCFRRCALLSEAGGGSPDLKILEWKRASR